MSRKTSVLSFILVFAGTLLAGDFVVIGNKSLSGVSFEKATVGNIFLGKVSRHNGAKVVAVTLNEGAVHESFLTEIVAKSGAQFRAYWNQMVFTGKGTPPVSFTSDKEVVKFVSENEGAIGYVASGTDIASVVKIEPQK